MSASPFQSVNQLREMMSSCDVKPTLLAEYFSLVCRYEAECKQRAIEHATEVLQATVSQNPSFLPKVEWNICDAQISIPLIGLFDFSKAMDAHDGATNFASGWPVIDFLTWIEQLEALGSEVLLDVIATPGRGSKGGLYGIANIVMDMDSIAGQMVYREAMRLQKWQSERQAWGDEFDERRWAKKKVRGEHVVDWISRVRCPTYQHPDRNDCLSGASFDKKSREPKRSGHLSSGLAYWRQFWNYAQGKKAA